MTRSGPRGTWIIALSFVLALLLTALPLPAWASAWRPAWVAMVLAYWCMALPGRVGILTGWCAGLLLDVLHGALLGQHALGLAILAALVLAYHKRLRVFSLVQQALVIGLLLAAYGLLQAGIDRIAGIPGSLQAVYMALPSMLLWPWIFVILRDTRRRWRVS